jgi:hypothetical protein
LLISIITIDSDTFEVSLSLSAILLGGSIAIAIGDTFFDCIAIDYRDTFRQYRYQPCIRENNRFSDIIADPDFDILISFR